eukprot:Tbor_TRINITY_DN702_c0_g1::TRINITY_DN702_c0_g1_i1::g.3363::m.3363/K00655/plsC; 1-acyl-sn-glycerol-3-phosphate acyltransferase
MKTLSVFIILLEMGLILFLVLSNVSLISVYVALKARVAPRILMKGWFVFSVAFSGLLCAASTFVLDAFKYLGVSVINTQRWCCVACNYAFNVVLLVNPQITVHIEESMVKWKDIPKSSAMLMTHTSFLDAFFFVGKAETRYIIDTRSLIKASLHKIPIFGGVFNRVGHFPVYFESNNEGAFAVDTDRQINVQKKIHDHLARGGGIALFPEGQLNRNPEQLLSFRRGSFVILIEKKLPIYYAVMINNEKVWPPTSLAGEGAPAHLVLSLGKIEVDYEKETDATALSIKCRDIMQSEVDRLKSKYKASSISKKNEMDDKKCQ